MRSKSKKKLDQSALSLSFPVPSSSLIASLLCAGISGAFHPLSAMALTSLSFPPLCFHLLGERSATASESTVEV